MTTVYLYSQEACRAMKKNLLTVKTSENYKEMWVENEIDNPIYYFCDPSEFSNNVPMVVSEVLRSLGYIVQEEMIDAT